MFLGMEFCPHCGAKAAREVVDDTTVACPGCKADMHHTRVGSTLLYECSACASTWLTTESFQELCLNREQRGLVATLIGSDAPPKTPSSAAEAVRYVHCPTCSKIMNRANFGHRSGIIVDVCKGHGVWFEFGELSGVLTFIESGGLERAKADEAEAKAETERAMARALRDSAILKDAPMELPTMGQHDEGWGTMLLRTALEKLLT